MPVRKQSMLQLPLLFRYPWKGIYVAWFTIMKLVIAVFMTAFYIFPANRPRNRWTLTRSLFVWWVRSSMILLVKTGFLIGRDVTAPLPWILRKYARRERIDRAPEYLIGKELSTYAKANKVSPVTVSAFWHGSPPTARMLGAGEIVVLHMHGGAMILGFASPEDSVSRGLRKFCGSRINSVLSVDYRLASSMPLPPSNAFPAALLDVIAAYRYLVLECHCPPERILLSGDSAGGALAIGLVRHLGTLADPDLRRPFALFLSSPWVDLSDSHLTNNPSCSIISNANCDIWSDYIVEDGMLFRSPMAGLINYARRSYIGFMEPEVMQHNPFISPASLYLTTPDGLFTGFPRTYIVSAGAEACRDSIRTLRDRLRADVCKEQDDPNWVVYDEYEDAIHDFLAFEFHTPERKEAFQRFARWLDNVVDSSIS